jgi:hypothetical protein
MMHSISSHPASAPTSSRTQVLPVLAASPEARGAVALGGPADAGERGARLADIEVGDAHDVEPRDALGLRQHHRAELAGADQADPDRAAARCPLLEHGRKVHAVLPGDATSALETRPRCGRH